MLKKSVTVVLASFTPSTYPLWEKRLSRQARGGRVRANASVLHSLRPCWTAFLSILWVIHPYLIALG